jgi:hypothetical protein
MICIVNIFYALISSMNHAYRLNFLNRITKILLNILKSVSISLKEKTAFQITGNTDFFDKIKVMRYFQSQFC